MKSKIKRYLRKIIGWSVITLVALILVLVTMLTLVDATVYRDPLQAGFTALMGRPVKFEGEMSIKPSLRPWVVIENLHIANPTWASRRDFAHADRLEIQVALWPLLTGDLKILNLVVEGSDILLETSADGRNNWSFTQKSDQPTTLPDIESLSWNRSVFGFRSGSDPAYRLAIAQASATLTENELIQFNASAAYQGTDFTLSLLGGKPSALVASDKPWPIKLALKMPAADFELEGSLLRPFEGKGLDLQIAVTGEQFEDLSSVFDVTFPALGPYAFSGRLTEADNRYSITNFSGHFSGTETVGRLALTGSTGSVSVDAPIELLLDGAYADVPFTITFEGGSLAELIAPTRPWPVKLEAAAANASVLVEGSVAEPLAWDDFDITLAISAKQIGDLGPLVNVELPALGDFALSARVTAINEDYTVTKLAGYLGQVKAKNHLAIKAGEVSLAHGKPISLKVEGSFGDVPFGMSLDGGTMAELMIAPVQWPIRMTVDTAGATLDISSTMAWPVDEKELDLEVKIRGQRLSALEPLLGFGVPALGSYQLSGRVTYDDEGYTVTDFKAAIAGTDATGLLALNSNGTRPHIRAKLVYGTFNLGNLIPADTPDSREDREPAWLDSPLPTAMFRDIDADIEIAVKNLVGAPTAIRDLSITAELDHGRLTLAPIALTLPGGRIKGRVRLDASTDNPDLDIDLTADQFDIDKIEALANVKQLRAGLDDLQVQLSSSGKTFRELLQGSNFQLTTAALDLRYRTQVAGRVVPIRLSRVAITTDPGQPINIALEGTLRRLPFSLRYVGDRLENLVSARESWPVALSGQVSGLTFETKGELTQPFGNGGFDLSFAFTGDDLSSLDPLLDTDLPTRGPYRLSGRMIESDNIYRLAELDLSLEDDHATGSLTLNMDGPRPGIVAKFTVDEFHLEDAIEELIEEEEGEVDDKRLFSDFAIPVDALRAVEVDLELLITRVLGNVTDLGDISIKAKLDNGRLMVSPMQAVLAGGQITSSLDLDARSTPPLVSLQISVKDLDYGHLLDALDYKDIEGEGDVEINLTSQGATLHDLLGRANGKVEFVSEAGKIGRGDIDLWAADLVTTMLSPKWALEKHTELNCLVARFDVTDGVAQASSILLDTKRITVAATGTVDLGTERLNMKLTPAPKTLSFISLATPVQVTGTLVESKVTVTRKSKATSFSKILLPFVNPYFLLYSGSLGSGHNPCEAAIAGDKISPAEEFR